MQPVFRGRAAVFFPEHAVEVTAVLISDMYNDLIYGKRRILQQIGGLLETSELQELFEILSCPLLQYSAHLIGGQMRELRDLSKSPVLIVMLNVIKHREHQILLFVLRISAADQIRKSGQVHEKQTHGGLIDRIHHGVAAQDRPDHIFQKIFNGNDSPGPNVEIIVYGCIAGQGGDGWR